MAQMKQGFRKYVGFDNRETFEFGRMKTSRFKEVAGAGTKDDQVFRFH